MPDREKALIIALDEGTTNAKAIALDARGRVQAKASRPLTLQTPRAGWVEQDGEQIIAASLAVIADVIAQIGTQPIAALAISSQRETVIGWWRDSGRPLQAAISWQCTRGAPLCAALRQRGEAPHIQATTGLPVTPLFSASKMRWLLDAVPQGERRAQQGELCLGTMDSWLLWHLTQGDAFCCDYSNASRTQLLNLHSGNWDDAMLALFQIPRAALPTVRPSSGLFGYTRGLRAIPDGIPILAMIGDSHAALYGHALGEAGCVKATYGTGSSIMAPVTAATPGEGDTLASTLAWHDGDRLVRALEGNIAHTGDAVAWMAESTGLNALPPAERERALNTLPATVESTLGVCFVPALTGLGAPWWDENARGVICGLSRGVTRAHLIRAALESIAYQVADVVDAMRRQPDFTLSALMADGGPTRNDWLMQYQADLLGCPVRRSEVPELSAIGAALLARKALGASATALRAQLPAHRTFQPDLTRHERLQQRWQAWRRAVERTLWQPQSTAPV